MSEAATRTPILLSEGEDIFNKLGIAVSDHRVFSSRHPRFLESCESCLKAIDAFFQAHVEQKHLLFVHRQGSVFFRKMPLAVMTPPAIKLARLFQEKKVEGFRLGPRSNLTALTCIVESLFLADEPGQPAWRTANRRLESEGLKGRLGFFADSELSGLEDTAAELTADSAAAPGLPTLLSLPGLAMPLDLYKSTLAALHDLMTLVSAGASPTFDPVLDITERLTSTLYGGGAESFLPLTTMQYSDQFTFNHSVNVCLLVTAALKPFVKNPERLLRIGQAALLHDLGKSLVEDKVFYQRGLPGTDERREIERHPRLGAEMLQDALKLDPLTAVVAFDHHRRPAGRGYPAVRRERPIDVITSLVAAADIFEALTAQRPYKGSLSAAEAFQVFLRLPEAEGLEPAARLLFDTVSPFPPGTCVQLDNGELAMVTRVRPREPLRPWVRWMAYRGGQMQLSTEESDLAVPPPGRDTPLRIVRSLPLSGDTGAATPNGAGADTDDKKEHQRREIEHRLAEGTLLASEG
jgi:HD-GYP domain-containing protein (c-di-GMP phosphodiesterase class II)